MVQRGNVSLNQREFVLEALRGQLRIDGRPLDEYRPLDLFFGQEYGHCTVSLGKTQVTCIVSSDITIPAPDRKFEGMLTIAVEFSPMASLAVEAGRQSMNEVILARLLEKTIRRSSALDTESLCLVAGSKCFHIRADVHVLSDDGNLVDSACIALLASLQHFRRPEVSIEAGSVTVWGIREREPAKLNLLHHPYCVTLGIFDNGTAVLVDMNLTEYDARDGELTLSVNRHGEICQIMKQGGQGVAVSSFTTLARLAIKKAQAFSDLVDKRLVEDERQRNIKGFVNELKSDNRR